MAFIVDEESGDITLVQGDNGQYVITGLPTDKNYTACFAIYDSKRKPIGSEINVLANYAEAVVFTLTPSLTDLLTVKTSEATAEYYFGIKLCHPDGIEDTLLLGDSEMGDLNTMTVYPKKVEGTAYEVTETTDTDTDTDTEETA